MEKNSMELRKLIRGVMAEEIYYIEKLRDQFIGFIVARYRTHIEEQFGNCDMDDVENICLHKLIRSISKFRGNSWKEFRAYNISIIIREVSNYREFLINQKQSDYIQEYEDNTYSMDKNLEDAVIDGMIYDYIIKESKLSEKEEKYRDIIKNYGTIDDYLKENGGNGSALNQAGYRMRMKLRKKMNELDIDLT